ncbi:hypothetical protein [Cochlodiniinecator piscidefendens]|uniref:hypothetical protein n=1 Tax=Cochlodiniinecator piscidefendens TaxID=2715756 RepID=UPI0014082342|nr:hypothetical protein [Cochlodiniinecator piscidefendens]
MRLRNCLCLIFLFTSEVHASEVETEQAEAAAAIIETCFEEMRPPSFFETTKTLASLIFGTNEYDPFELQRTMEGLGIEAIEPAEFSEFSNAMFLSGRSPFWAPTRYLVRAQDMYNATQLSRLRQYALEDLEHELNFSNEHKERDNVLDVWRPAPAYWAAHRVPVTLTSFSIIGSELHACNLTAPNHSAVYDALTITPETPWVSLDQRDIYATQFGNPLTPHTELIVIRLHPEFADEQDILPLQIVITTRGF